MSICELEGVIKLSHKWLDKFLHIWKCSSVHFLTGKYVGPWNTRYFRVKIATLKSLWGVPLYGNAALIKQTTRAQTPSVSQDSCGFLCKDIRNAYHQKLDAQVLRCTEALVCCWEKKQWWRTHTATTLSCLLPAPPKLVASTSWLLVHACVHTHTPRRRNSKHFIWSYHGK